MEEDTSTPGIGGSSFEMTLKSQQSGIFLKDPTRTALIEMEALNQQLEYDLMWGGPKYWDEKEKEYEANRESDIRFLMKQLGYSRKRAKTLVDKHTPKFFRPEVTETSTTTTGSGLYQQIKFGGRQIGKFNRAVIEEAMNKLFNDGSRKEKPEGDP